MNYSQGDVTEPRVTNSSSSISTQSESSRISLQSFDEDPIEIPINVWKSKRSSFLRPFERGTKSMRLPAFKEQSQWAPLSSPRRADVTVRIDDMVRFESVASDEVAGSSPKAHRNEHESVDSVIPFAEDDQKTPKGMIIKRLPAAGEEAYGEHMQEPMEQEICLNSVAIPTTCMSTPRRCYHKRRIEAAVDDAIAEIDDSDSMSLKIKEVTVELADILLRQTSNAGESTKAIAAKGTQTEENQEPSSFATEYLHFFGEIIKFLSRLVGYASVWFALLIAVLVFGFPSTGPQAY